MTQEELLMDMAKGLRDARRDTMAAQDKAIFDLQIMVELWRRGATKDLVLEMRVLAHAHSAASPYVAAILKAMADLATQANPVLAFTSQGRSPCP